MIFYISWMKINKPLSIQKIYNFIFILPGLLTIQRTFAYGMAGKKEHEEIEHKIKCYSL